MSETTLAPIDSESLQMKPTNNGRRIRKSILNYTTEIAPQKTLSEITELLVQAKAEAILSEYKDGTVTAISFRIKTEFGILTYRLPANIDGVQIALQQDKALPYKLRTQEHATRVAWRIIKDWLEAQLALIRANLVSLDQVFLPFAQDGQGRTVYDRMREKRFEGLLLTNN